MAVDRREAVAAADAARAAQTETADLADAAAMSEQSARDSEKSTKVELLRSLEETPTQPLPGVRLYSAIEYPPGTEPAVSQPDLEEDQKRWAEEGVRRRDERIQRLRQDLGLGPWDPIPEDW